VHEGELERLKPMIGELVSFVEASAPDLLAYGVYFTEDERQMTVVHLHRDSSTLEHLMEAGGPVFRKFADLLTLTSIDIYGEPSETVVERARAKAEMLGGGQVTVHSPEGQVSRLD
jgi:hypothetical protein